MTSTLKKRSGSTAAGGNASSIDFSFNHVPKEPSIGFQSSKNQYYIRFVYYPRLGVKGTNKQIFGTMISGESSWRTEDEARPFLQPIWAAFRKGSCGSIEHEIKEASKKSRTEKNSINNKTVLMETPALWRPLNCSEASSLRSVQKRSSFFGEFDGLPKETARIKKADFINERWLNNEKHQYHILQLAHARSKRRFDRYSRLGAENKTNRIRAYLFSERRTMLEARISFNLSSYVCGW